MAVSSDLAEFGASGCFGVALWSFVVAIAAISILSLHLLHSVSPLAACGAPNSAKCHKNQEMQENNVLCRSSLLPKTWSMPQIVLCENRFHCKVGAFHDTVP